MTMVRKLRERFHIPANLLISRARARDRMAAQSRCQPQRQVDLQSQDSYHHRTSINLTYSLTLNRLRHPQPMERRSACSGAIQFTIRSTCLTFRTLSDAFAGNYRWLLAV